MTVIKTKLQQWPKQPPPAYHPPVPLTDSERIDRLEWMIWGTEPEVRVQIWMEDRAGRLAEKKPDPVAVVPLCERKR